MNKSLTTLICMMCLAVAAFGVYMVKYVVQDVQREVASLDAEVKKERESLHLLNAEWAYLNRPERLHALADKHLALAPLDSRQIQDVAILPAAYEGEESGLLIHTGSR